MARHFWLLLSLTASSCYLSHGVGDAGGVAHEDGGVADAPLLARDVPDAPSRPCGWSATPSWQLTTPPGDQRHFAVLATSAGYLVAYGSSNDPPPVPGRFVARVGLEGPLGEPVLVFGAPRGFYPGGLGLASGTRGVLAITYDEFGCRSRLLSSAGVPLASDVTVPRSNCVTPYAVGERFAVFDRPGDGPAHVALLDESGATLRAESSPIDALDGAFWWARAGYDDGSQLVISMQSGVEPSAAYAQHLSAEGEPLAPPVVLHPFTAASRVRAAATEGGALVGWLESPDGDPTSQERELRVFPVDRDGVPLDVSVVVSTLPAYRDGGLSMVRIGSEVMAAYIESEPGDRFGRATRVRALRLSARGEVLQRFAFAEEEFARTPLLGAGSGEVLVAYSSRVGSGATQVSIAGLRCE